MGATRLLGLALACAIGLWHVEARAQCERSCPDNQRDEFGCCRAAKPPPPTTSQPPPPPPPKAEECHDGKIVSPDTAGHCCWAGQVWSTNKCVGVPTGCPAERTLKEQECVLPQCPAGMLRGADKTHCCWPAQAWSSTRNVCVGIPSCPKGFEVQGEGCVSEDMDGDGIPNSVDKCPTVAEDRNGFEDEDGCPDEDRRLAGLAEAERKRVAEAKARADREAAIIEAKQKAEADAKKRADDAARRVREQEQQEAEARAKAEKEAVESSKSTRRAIGYTFLVLGITSGVVSAVSMGLGAGENSKIKSGGFANSAAILSAESTGHTYNTLAIGFGVGGLIAFGGGLGLALSAPAAADAAPKAQSASLSLSPALGARGVVATVRW